MSWRAILAKREKFRAAFEGADFERIAAFRQAGVERLMTNDGIVRHRDKIEASSTTPGARDLVEREGSLAAYVWRFEPSPDDCAPPQTASPSPVSIALSLRT